MHPQRKSIRLPHYDYSTPGMYFVTICTHERQPLFGTIDAGGVILNPYGQFVEQIWHQLPDRFPNLENDAFILMPNHVHAILFLYPPKLCPNQGGASPSPTAENATANTAATPRPTLSDIICVFKSQSAIGINKLRMTPAHPVWQRTYYEHIIRTGQSLDDLRRYIHENPARWTAGNEDPYGEDFSIFQPSENRPRVFRT